MGSLPAGVSVPVALTVRPEDTASQVGVQLGDYDNQGTVPVDNVVGRVVLTVWPLSAFSTHPVPEIPFDDPRLDQQQG